MIENTSRRYANRFSKQTRTDHTDTYTVFYDDIAGAMQEVEVIANDHECALKQVELRDEVANVRLIFSGSVPKPIWIG